jgi:nicotinamide-nucleotide amidase
MDLAFFARKLGVKIVFLESCTGGLASSWISSLHGSSTWFEGGLVTYSNKMKTIFLGIDEHALEFHGAVSEQIAGSMAHSFFKKSFKNIVTSSITGIAGPGGGSQEKPVGLVFFGWDGPWGLKTLQKIFNGNRQQIREQAAMYAIINLAKKIAITK